MQPKGENMKTNKMPYVYFHGAIVPESQATISIASNSLQYGSTCFAGIRGYHRAGAIRIFRLHDHYLRLMNASKIMGLGYFITYPAFVLIVEDLIIKNSPTVDFYLRPFIFSQDEQLAPKVKGLSFELAIYMVPLSNYFDTNTGMRLMISSWRKFPDASFPTKAKAGGCYVNSMMATGEAMRCGYDEALLMDHEGFIVEASVANILISYRNRIIMPEIGSAMLEGITMRTMVELLEGEGEHVHYEKIDRSMIYTCDEMLLMGTAAQVVYVESVDGRHIGKSGEKGLEPSV